MLTAFHLSNQHNFSRGKAMSATDNYNLINQQNLELLKTCKNLFTDESCTKLKHTSLRESWFILYGYQDVMNRIIEETRSSHPDLKFSQRVWAFFHQPFGTCAVCGNPTRAIKGGHGWTETCSTACGAKHASQNHEKRHQKDLTGKKTVLKNRGIVSEDRLNSMSEDEINALYRNTMKEIRKRIKDESIQMSSISDDVSYSQMEIENTIETLKNSSLFFDGKLSSDCCSFRWFKKQGFEKEWNIMMFATSELKDWQISKRIWAFFHLPIPHCPECGKLCRKVGRNDWSKFCSDDCALHSKIRSKKISDSWLNRTSQESYETNEKRKATMLNKYGVEFNTQRQEVRKIIGEKAIERAHPTILIERLSDVFWLNEEYNVKLKTGTEIAKDLSKEFGFQVDYSTVLAFCKRAGFSIRQRNLHSSIEKEVIEFIQKDLGIEEVGPNNKILGGERSTLEIDVWIPEKNVGIELNGLYWHSAIDRQPEREMNRHLSKTLLAKEKEIRLFHFTDIQWNEKQDVVKSMIRNAVGMTENKIFARNCTIHNATSVDERREINQFLNENHIQSGRIPSKVMLCLRDRETQEIVSVMTFGRPRFSKSHEWELLRFANRLNTTVVGGFSRLLKNFVKLYDPSNIVSYADHSRSYGNVYEKCGFVLDHISSPGYCWTDGKSEPLQRYHTQKSKLKDLLGEKFDSALSENQNMLNAGYRKFYDCGQLVYVWNNNM